MESQALVERGSVTPDTDVFFSYAPVPSYGLLPVNAFLIRATEPVLIDTGMIAVRDGLLRSLRSAIALADLRWLWLTHTDPDHIGNLEPILREAPRARVVTTFLGMAKMGVMGLPVDRVYLLNPGESLDVGDRRLMCLAPPTFDAPETTGLFDSKTRVLFSADCFGALLTQPADSADDISPSVLREGLVTWATIDAPWLSMVEERGFLERLDAVRRLAPHAVLSSHLPPASRITDRLLKYLDEARSAPSFRGPNQAALEQMMAAATSTV